MSDHRTFFPLTTRPTAYWALQRRRNLPERVKPYHGEGGRLQGWRGDGIAATPTLVAPVPRALGRRIEQAALEFRASLPEHVQQHVFVAPTSALHVTFCHTPLFLPEQHESESLQDFVTPTVAALSKVLAAEQPFTFHLRGFDSLPKVGVTRVLAGGEHLTRVKAAIWEANVPLMRGDNPYLGPTETAIENGVSVFGVAAHATSWIYTGEVDSEVILDALRGRRVHPQGDMKVTHLELNANVHRNGPVHSGGTLATFELGRGLVQSSGIELG